jgi:hypothetical protein
VTTPRATLGDAALVLGLPRPAFVLAAALAAVGTLSAG